MSLIFITNHDENIYNITKNQTDLQKKSPRYKSKFQKSKIQTVTTAVSPICVKSNGKKHATMGVPEEEPPDPHNYLKKRTGKPSYTMEKPEQVGRLCKKTNLPHKGPTPLIKDLIEEAKKHEKEVESTKNFIKGNVETVKNMKPKEPEHRVVIDKAGTTIYPELQGLEPVYIKKTIFGRTPEYLVRFNKIKEKEYQMRKDASGKQQPKCRYITRDEREQLLTGLKKNWEELQKQYQGLPILTDTIPKKVKKSKLEADLKQLEKDIVLVERHPYIYVYNDTELS
ncbi:enkurin [Anthonomus grandis grandis]|uniref:enkurin n=1 Tax=Anthonomus grandis grandis TaxID=2921223 RepID=UPI0021656428|nr:enkurin [Anthonomus grandis grandis]